jgi:hypothetical protein
MKKYILTAAVGLGMFAVIPGFRTNSSSITGRVSPVDAAESVWAISGSDSVRGVPSAGAFTLSVKAGTYKVVVDAKDPYKDILLENVMVKDDEPANVGELVLVK